MKLKKLRKTTILLIIACLFVLAINIFLGFMLTKQSSAALRTLIEYRMLDISNTAAAMLDGDSLQLIRAEDKARPEYQSVLKTLAFFQENIDLEYIYCIRDLGGGNFVFTIDPAEDPGEFGEAIEYTDALHRAALGIPAVDKEPYEDRWDRFYSAYSPVFNSSGPVAGIVAVDFSAAWYEKQISNQVWTTVLISGLSLLLSGFALFMLATRFRNRFRHLIKEMNGISEGIETLVYEISPKTETRLEKSRADTQSNDEIAVLGNQMRSLGEQLGREIAMARSRAYVDALTGVGNRTAYEDHTHELDAKIKQGTARFAIVLADLNGLKEINDRQGHEAGDRAIIALSGMLRQTFADGKTYRIGGDEFVVILEGETPDIEARLKTLDRLLEKDGAVAAAKGSAAFDPDADIMYREVFRRADNGMYDDKKRYYLTHKDRRK